MATKKKANVDATPEKKAATPRRAAAAKKTPAAGASPRRPGRQERGTGDSALSKEKIVAAAIEQIDRNGVLGFSVRDVARSLGVYPAAVYWHVPTRDDLLARVVEATMAGVTPTQTDLTWQAWIKELFVRSREVMRRHPNIAQLVSCQMLANASLNPAMVDRILAVLIDAGCPESKIVQAYNVVTATMVGFATMEFAAVPTDEPDAWAARLQQKVHDIRALEFPTLARYLPAMANHAFIVRWQNGVEAPMDSSFDAYVDVVIAGLAAYMKAKA